MNYQLHDCEIDSIILENDSIVFSFPNGFYVADENGHKLEPSGTKLAFIIDRSLCPNEPLESFIFIRRINRRMNGWKYISFKQFAALFKKGNMMIHDEFDSKLTNRKMFQLNANTSMSNIELFIDDIVNIVCLYDGR